MIISKIWERYFLGNLLRTTLFVIACTYGLYVLLDYASHSASFHRHQVQFQWKEVILYYICEFFNRLEVLLPLSLLLATIRTLTTMNVHNELVALMSSGVSVQRLMHPFVCVGLAAVSLMYINFEIVLPKAAQELKQIHDGRSSKKIRNRAEIMARSVQLEDRSTLIFQEYDAMQQSFFDAYWIRNIDDIYRMTYLKISTPLPLGLEVDHLQRNAQGDMVVMETFSEHSFDGMSFNRKALFESTVQPEEQSLSELWQRVPSHIAMSEKEAQVMTTFYHKLMLPWLCLLAIIGPAPFCLRITRNLPVFFVYAGSLFGLVATYVVLDATVLLGERQALPPFWAVCAPFACVLSILLWRFVRLR